MEIIRANMTNLVNSMTDTTDSIEDFIKKYQISLAKKMHSQILKE